MKRRTYYDWSPICDEARVEKSRTPTHRRISVTIGPDGAHDLRLDQYLAAALRSYPRSLLQQWFRNGYITNAAGRTVKASLVAKAHATFILTLPHPRVHVEVDAPLNILYEDSGCLLVNKPPGQLPHPAGKQLTGTLLNKLQEWAPLNGNDPEEMRLVNRIDKDTSGLVLISRNIQAHNHLAKALRSGRLDKRYQALCEGIPSPAIGHWRDAMAGPLDPDQTIAQRICPEADGGKPSHTGYKVRETVTTTDGKSFSWLDIELFTGRQHQIRLHAAHNGHPLLGDWVYGTPIKEIGAQALHAWRLTFPRPSDNKLITIEAPLCGRIEQLWQQLSSRTPPTTRGYSDDERSKIGLVNLDTPDPEDFSDVLPPGWRRPTWLKSDELRALAQQETSQEDD